MQYTQREPADPDGVTRNNPVNPALRIAAGAWTIFNNQCKTYRADCPPERTMLVCMEVAMGYMTICHEFSDGAYAELTGPDIKYWFREGLPLYEGGLDGFQECYPERMDQLIARKLVKRIPDDDPAPM